MQKTILVAAVVLGAVSFFGYDKMTEPKTYEECVLKNIGPHETEAAVRVKTATCRKMFPPPPNPFDQFDNQNPSGK